VARGPDRYVRLFTRLVLLAVLVVLLTRLVGFVVRFGNESLQADLAAYYTAGLSAAADLSPYVNQVGNDPPIWDGVNVFRHSRFLYPPLAAGAFSLLAPLPYQVVKFAWMTLTLAALAGALLLAVRLTRMPPTLDRVLVLGIVGCWFWPVLTLLERGQVDAFTLLLLLAALRLMQSRRPRSSLAAGCLVALATLLKLNCAFLIPFLALRRRWRTVGGFLLGVVVLLGLDLAVSGPARVSDYLFRELPRISAHGEGGTREMSLPRSTFAGVLAGVQPQKTVLDGRSYSPDYFKFVLNGSLVQALPGKLLRRAAVATGLPEPGLSQLALVFLALFFAVFLALHRRRGPPADEPVYWQSVLVVILLCGPVTWAMGAVWLLPVLPLLLREVPRANDSGLVRALVLCTLGLLLAGAPDPYGFFMLSPFGVEVLNGKYVLGQLLCLVGLFGLWRRRS